MCSFTFTTSSFTPPALIEFFVPNLARSGTLFRRLRNHVEHFDERLDRWVRDFDGHAFFDMNIITGATGFPEKAFLRVLDGDTFKFHGESYNMTELHAAGVEIDGRLTKACCDSAACRR
jgi:hypothetical protein